MRGPGARLAACLSVVLALAGAGPAPAMAQVAPTAPDITAKRAAPDHADYIKRVVMVPMRDGVRLHTVIVIPKGARRAPMLLTRTPYNAAVRTQRAISPSMLATLPQGDESFVQGGYIRVVQDVRGKYGSEGDYVMARPLRGPLNDTATDHATDAWDTIEWLTKNVPESNGKVGILGSSYDGFTALMALIDPHPALKVAVPMSPMVDGWRGDDWFHNGAFRVAMLDYIAIQTSIRARGEPLATGVYDDYEGVLREGSVGGYARRFGLDKLNFVRKLFDHPAYDSFWQGQAVDRLLAGRTLSVPTMTVVGQWDQEDIYGAYAVYAALEKDDPGNDLNYLVIGPWRHSGVNFDGSALGPLRFTGDTALAFRRDVMQPFLDQHLKDGAARADTPPVLSYQTGTDGWQRLQRWPLSCAEGCPARTENLYLQDGFGLAFSAPQGEGGYDEYVSDPAKPVPFVPRPVRMHDADIWKPWLVSDQRFVADRPDVLTYVSAPLSAPLQLSGAPAVDLFASTSGTDADWVVKLIDVYPDEVPSRPELGGYQLPLAMDIFRGRYRDSLEHPAPLASGQPLRYRFALPNVNHVILPGHRLMVQIQSSWFPLYDRNPQRYVPNIFHAQPGDYVKATHRIYHAPGMRSAISLPVVRHGGR
ncbi:CocE/NonD family hydrolase [Massilia sp.]|uniref:CocE/NonD family hydrolase n=1 Tax=Massilia sp. TaxID=1882437 RepID=UPI00289960AA|nr:CocE/NonD family hydrolase [Massilia sp.]